MKPQKPGSSATTRRGFLKNTGAVSAALAGTFGLNDAFSIEAQTPSSSSGQCGFSQLPHGFVYLNSGTEGSMPDCVVNNFRDGLHKWAGNPTHAYETDAVFNKRQDLNRETVGKFLGVEKNNICLTDNTTMGLSMTLMGLNFQPGDRVVASNHEHNAILSPLAVQRATMGLEVITRAFPPAHTLRDMNSDELLDTLFPDSPSLRGAKALCVSHVYPTTGVRLPLKALRRKADQLNIRYLVVDGAQAMGMIDLGTDNDNITLSDFYACPGHKWLNGPPSTGVLYLRNANIRPPEFHPTLSQRMGEYTGGNEVFPMAEALQVRGCSNTPGFAAMIRALHFQQEMGGPAQIEKQILSMSQRVKNHILNRAPSAMVSPHLDPTLKSGLSVFFPFNWDKPKQLFTDKARADWVVRELLKKGIQIRSIGFTNAGAKNNNAEKMYALRVSTGIFNTVDQVEIFNRALTSVLKNIA
ncbi:MAG: aminotransferase class V-fold PLP-dependent enzyme [Proteobacteria bacterium]|nr:aminotransferase class V-fold PLP-dependent enzyme [Pseudomonadota bacterium]